MAMENPTWPARDQSSTVSVLLNSTAPGSSTASFANKQDFAVGDRPYSVTVGDFNGDGKPDLAIANFSSNHGQTVSVLLNETPPGSSTATFAAKQDFTTGTGPISVTVGDVNGDGKSDLVVANYYSKTLSVLLNQTAPGSSTVSFAPKQDFDMGDRPHSVAVGDVNGDGKPDLAVSILNSNTVSVLLNQTTPGSSTASFAAKQDFTTGSTPFSVAVGISTAMASPIWPSRTELPMTFRCC